MSGIGTFDHRVTLDAPGAPVPDNLGGYTETFTPLTPAEWWCSVQPATAADMERVVGTAAITTTATHLVRGRYHAGVTTATRLHLHDGRLLQVQSVQDDRDGHRRLLLLCTEVA